MRACRRGGGDQGKECVGDSLPSVPTMATTPLSTVYPCSGLPHYRRTMPSVASNPVPSTVILLMNNTVSPVCGIIAGRNAVFQYHAPPRRIPLTCRGEKTDPIKDDFTKSAESANKENIG